MIYSFNGTGTHQDLSIYWLMNGQTYCYMKKKQVIEPYMWNGPIFEQRSMCVPIHFF